MVPTLAQELAGNFHESRESFHDYIYSKLILGEEKSGSPIVSNPNPPVFPNTNLASCYPNSMSIVSNVYSLSSNSGNHDMIESGDGHPGGGVSKVFSVPSAVKTAGTQKSGNPKKKPHIQQNTAQPDCPASGEDLTKVKKKSHHKKKDKTNVCDVCQRGFAEKYTLNRHMLTHTHIKPYSCSKCNMSFSRSDGLAKHMAAGHRRIDAHHCDVCGGTFNSEVSFEQHRREYGNTLPFVCNLCMLAFSQCCHLNYHMKSHSLSKMNDSFVPDSLDDKNSTIDVSELIPDDFSPPKKDESKNSFGGLILSPSKVGVGHVGRASDHSLGIIDPNIVIKPEIEDFSTCRATASHMPRNSAGEGSNLEGSSYDALNSFPSVTPSSNASQTMVNSQSLQSMPISTPSYLPETSGSLNLSRSSEPAPISDAEIKKYLDIKIPNPKFLEASLLQNANMSEDGLFRCELCSKGFTRKYHMQRHVKLHIRGPVPKAHLLDWTRRPYACGVCKMGFTRQHHLTRHMLIHTGERPHSCHVCGKAFRRFTNLTLHVRTVHGAERPFKCHICGRGFPRLYSLQRHLKLHAKNAARLNSAETDQLYAGFKPVGTINLEGTASSYSMHESPGHSRESISSDNSDDSDRFDHESHSHENSMEHIDPSGNDSPVANQDRYTLLQEERCETGFQPRNNLHAQLKDQTASSHSGQVDRLGQPGPPQHRVMTSTDSNIQVIKSRIVNSGADSMLQHDVTQARSSGDFSPSPRPGGETLGNQAPVKMRNATELNPQQSIQSANSERFIPSSLSTQNLQAAETTASRNFSELDVREGGSYSLVRNGSEGFIIHQHGAMMSLLERPGSRGVISPAGGPDSYHSSPGGSYIQSPLLTQQRASVDVSATRATMSPAGVRDPAGGYSHSHLVDMAGSRSSITDSTAYSHNHSVNNMSFPGSGQSIYQQQLSDNLNHMDMHPNPSASPMPVSSHSNNMYTQ